MALLVFSIVLFLVLHSLRVFAPAWRERTIARMGVKAWRGAYSLLSIASLVLLIYAFGASRAQTPILYTPPMFMTHITLTLMLIAMILLMASILPAGKIAVWVKHPMVTSVKVWAFAHLLSNGELNSVLLFGGFLIWAVLVRISAKRRARAGEKVVRDFVSTQYDAAAILGGVALYAVILLYLHQMLIGVSPLAAAGL
ncbi:NnrU family protein [Rhizobium sp. C1]|uniref:NnrU family protein n=1 Tax=Rhizobium sp. C1 TaxID=1349799 RepID=UPI001E47A71B|nr:NnrU family protein [Rhizobium sp. C1]MCD2180136.1 NnrU family protein [Rhizobium sp. C1]